MGRGAPALSASRARPIRQEAANLKNHRKLREIRWQLRFTTRMQISLLTKASLLLGLAALLAGCQTFKSNTATPPATPGGSNYSEFDLSRNQSAMQNTDLGD